MTTPTKLSDIRSAFGYKLRNDWELNNTYRFYLHTYVIRRWDVSYFLSQITLSETTTTILFEGVTYTVVAYADRDLNELLTTTEPTMLISFRNPGKQSKYAPVALVKWW